MTTGPTRITGPPPVKDDRVGAGRKQKDADAVACALRVARIAQHRRVLLSSPLLCSALLLMTAD
jgi:hypothetical protein